MICVFKIEDLLGRKKSANLKVIASKLTDKTILITGAGGSIGSEICRQVSVFAETNYPRGAW